MIIDFQHHYTPPELIEDKGVTTTRLNENKDPIYRLSPLLADLPAHVRMMDQAGIDAAVLSCGQGCDQQNVATCRLINDRMQQAERDHPGRFIGLAHVPTPDPQEEQPSSSAAPSNSVSPGSSSPLSFRGSPSMRKDYAHFGRQLPILGFMSSCTPCRRSLAGGTWMPTI